jgi:transposase
VVTATLRLRATDEGPGHPLAGIRESSEPRFPRPSPNLDDRLNAVGPRNRTGKTGRRNPYLKGVLGEVAPAAAKTDTFLGERYRRIVRRRGRQRALVAVARSILVIVWHLLADPDTRFVELGSDFYQKRINTDRKTRDLVRQLQALGHQVTLDPAA